MHCVSYTLSHIHWVIYTESYALSPIHWVICTESNALSPIHCAVIWMCNTHCVYIEYSIIYIHLSLWYFDLTYKYSSIIFVYTIRVGILHLFNLAIDARGWTTVSKLGAILRKRKELANKRKRREERKSN